MSRNQTFEEIKRNSERKWMENARATAQSFIKPMSRTSRIQRYSPGHDRPFRVLDEAPSDSPQAPFTSR